MQPNKWEMKVRTDDDSFVCEITDGKISICVNDDGEEEDMQAIVDALNKAEVSFYSNNKLELDQHIEIMQLQDEVRSWKAKYDELKEIVKDFTFKFAELNQANARLNDQNNSLHNKNRSVSEEYRKISIEHAALKEKAEKMDSVLCQIWLSAKPANEREMISWIQTAQQMCADALSPSTTSPAREKEVNNG